MNEPRYYTAHYLVIDRETRKVVADFSTYASGLAGQSKQAALRADLLNEATATQEGAN